jgi:hypothetical protein
MCGYIVKVCGSESRGVRAGQCELDNLICLSHQAFRAWHVTKIVNVDCGVGVCPAC